MPHPEYRIRNDEQERKRNEGQADELEVLGEVEEDDVDGPHFAFGYVWGKPGVVPEVGVCVRQLGEFWIGKKYFGS